jgi:hypothetical protein
MNISTNTGVFRGGPPPPLLADGAEVGPVIARGPDGSERPAVCVDLTVVNADGSERQVPVLVPAERVEWLAATLMCSLSDLAAAGRADPPVGPPGVGDAN